MMAAGRLKGSLADLVVDTSFQRSCSRSSGVAGVIVDHHTNSMPMMSAKVRSCSMSTAWNS